MVGCDDDGRAGSKGGGPLVVVPEAGLWRAADVARFLNVSEDWVWKQIRRRSGFPFIELGPRNYRFDPDAVRAWVAGRQRGSER
ncbi:helix-turn-helix transcriptional regulator [Myxococcus sp. AS-1-15]|uniref:helix-turn-helix transcriptional regulator n=1 Tax=Myxococcus sp. AS-1-15 TaxID=2874600 RepID=UPI00351D073F